MARNESYYKKVNVASTENGRADIYENSERYNSAGYTHFIREEPKGGSFSGRFEFCFDDKETVQAAIASGVAAENNLNWEPWEDGTVDETDRVPVYFFGRATAWRAISTSGNLQAVVIGTPAGTNK